MRIHSLHHVPYEPLGSIETWARRHGAAITHTDVFRGEPLPAHERYDFLVVMGGPMNVYEDADHPWLPAERSWIREAIHAGRHVLGICLGAQLIADALGARVTTNRVQEIGWFPVHHVSTPAGPLAAVTEGMDVLHWHGDTFAIPEGARRLLASEACDNQAFAMGDRVLALQFHLEAAAAIIADWIERSPFALGSERFLQASEEIMRDAERYARGQAAMDQLLDTFCAPLLATRD